MEMSSISLHLSPSCPNFVVPLYKGVNKILLYNFAYYSHSTVHKMHEAFGEEERI